MNAWNEHLARHRRLGILRILNEAPGYAANESLLHEAVLQLGVTSTRDQVRSELTWLAEQGLVKTATIGDLMTATITQRGSDIAQGLTEHPGVRRPSPA